MQRSVPSLGDCIAPALRMRARRQTRLAAAQNSFTPLVQMGTNSNTTAVVTAAELHCLLVPSSFSAFGALACGIRTFYDKIREKRDGSDEGPDQMFDDFVKSPHRQRVPAELHKGNKDAVDGAEFLNRIFFVFLLFLVGGVIYYIDPFKADQLSRPEGYGVTDPKKDVFGSSDRVSGVEWKR